MIPIDTSHVYLANYMPGPFGRVSAPPPHFPVGGPVPASDLVGRETYIRRLVERLGDGNHVLVAGPRRIGKTSIILEVLRRLKRRGAHTAYVDCLGATDIRGLGERLIDAVLENVSGVERSFEQAKAVAAGMRPSVKVRYEHIELRSAARARDQRAALLRRRARSSARARGANGQAGRHRARRVPGRGPPRPARVRCHEDAFPGAEGRRVRVPRLRGGHPRAAVQREGPRVLPVRGPDRPRRGRRASLRDRAG